MARQAAGKAINTSRRMGTIRAVIATGMLLLTGSVRSLGAELNAKTLRAWDEYIHAINERVTAGAQVKSFLWTDQSPDRIQRVRGGEVLVAPVGENPKIVPHGLIHHWIGAMFLPDVELNDVLGVVRDYNNYKSVYAPSVLDSRLLHQAGADDVFSLLFLNKAVVAKVALRAEFRSSYQSLDANRSYSVGYSTRIREIEEYGQAAQHELPSNTGHGFIWRLYNVSRFEQRDGGVYVELEGVALSRDVPSMLRWLVSPAIRSVSRDSMLVSLQKTGDAVSGTREVATGAERQQRRIEPKSAPANTSNYSEVGNGFLPGNSLRARH